MDFFWSGPGSISDFAPARTPAGTFLLGTSRVQEGTEGVRGTGTW